jgi:hypothetical protein
MSACALCGTPAPPPFRAPQPESAPDLDGRPGEPARSTLARWVQTCRSCRASAPDLAALPPTLSKLVQTEQYRRLGSPFLRWAALVAGTPAEAEAILQAAWSAEDAGEDGTALRRRALAVWPVPCDPESILRLVDLQRRAGLLDVAAATLDTLPGGSGDAAERTADFERARLMAGDTGRHLMSSALRPPARTPHVTHRQRAGTGFWGRLLGGGRS